MKEQQRENLSLGKEKQTFILESKKEIFSVQSARFWEEINSHTVFGQTTEGLDIVQKNRQGDKMLKVEVLEVDPKIKAHELQKLMSWR